MPSSVDELIALLEAVWGPMDPDTTTNWRQELNGKDLPTAETAIVALRNASARTPSIALFRATYRGTQNQKAKEQKPALQQKIQGDANPFDRTAWFAEQRAKLKREA